MQLKKILETQAKTFNMKNKLGYIFVVIFWLVMFSLLTTGCYVTSPSRIAFARAGFLKS